MERDLIYDIGAHDGSDTRHYLGQGYRVVAVEANPALAEALQREFRGAPVEVVAKGIWESPGTATFYVNDENSEHSSFVEEVGGRDGSAHHAVPVECVTFGSLLEEHGVPYYLKVDIEKADVHCLNALDASDLPAYISVEAHSLDYLCILYRLGYREFKCVDQLDLGATVLSNKKLTHRIRRTIRHFRGAVSRRRNSPYPLGSSGPFGEETPGEWRSFDEVAYDWLHHHFGHRRRGTLNPRGWVDFHAKL